MADNLTAFVNRIKVIRNQTSSILNELGDDIEEYRYALEDMNAGLSEALENFEMSGDPTNPTGGALAKEARRKKKSKKTRKTRR